MFRNRFYIPVPVHFALFVGALFWSARMIVRLSSIVWRRVLLPAHHQISARLSAGLQLRRADAIASEDLHEMARRRIEEIRRQQGR